MLLVEDFRVLLVGDEMEEGVLGTCTEFTCSVDRVEPGVLSSSSPQDSVRWGLKTSVVAGKYDAVVIRLREGARAGGFHPPLVDENLGFAIVRGQHSTSGSSSSGEMPRRTSPDADDGVVWGPAGARAAPGKRVQGFKVTTAGERRWSGPG